MISYLFRYQYSFSQIDDCTQEWTFAPNSLDYVHIRWLVGSIVDWPHLFKEAYRCLKPGGYLESNEALSRMDCDDGTIHEKSAMHQWGKFFVEGGKKIGRSFTIVEDGVQKKSMEGAGFVGIEERDFKVSFRCVIHYPNEVVNKARRHRCRLVDGQRIKSSKQLESMLRQLLSRTLKAMSSSWPTRWKGGRRRRLKSTSHCFVVSYERVKCIRIISKRSFGPKKCRFIG